MADLDISVSLDIPTGHGSSGPVTFVRTGVAPGAGVELDHTAVDANPSAWVGSLTVDVDPAGRRITVRSDASGDFQSAALAVRGLGATGLTVVSDSLWVSPSTDLDPALAPASAVGATMQRTGAAVTAAGDVEVTWHVTPADDAGTIELNPHGEAVFAYTVPAATSTTAAGSATTATSTSTTVPPSGAAQPVEAAPTYTG